MPDLIGEAEAHAIIDQVAPLYRADVNDGPRSRNRVQDAWQESEAVRALACRSEIAELLEALYGRRPFPFQTLNFSTGTQQRNHSDCIHFSSLPRGFMCGVWVALEDTDADNGPLFYAPGSHLLPELTLDDFGMTLETASYARYEEGIADAMAAAGLEFEEVHLPLGSAFVWSSNLVHGGTPIRKPGRTRHSQVTHYYFDDCVYYTPFFSEVATGELFVRIPIDVSSGRAVAPSLNGHPVTFEPARGDLMRLHYTAARDRATAEDLRARFALYAAGLDTEAEDALSALITVYQAREDLHHAFGGYDDVDIGRLVQWSVGPGLGGDTAAATLRPHADGLRRLAGATAVGGRAWRQRLRRR